MKQVFKDVKASSGEAVILKYGPPFVPFSNTNKVVEISQVQFGKDLGIL